MFKQLTFYVAASKIGTYLNDLFTVNWMKDSYANDLNIETLAK